MRPQTLRRCAAFGCAEPLETPRAEVCARHARLEAEFRLWLDGCRPRSAGETVLEDPAHPACAFDAARSLWQRQRSAR